MFMLCTDPAVSLMLLLRGKVSSAKALAYMAAQVAGCVLGAYICTIIIPGVQAGAGLGAPGGARGGRGTWVCNELRLERAGRMQSPKFRQ